MIKMSATPTDIRKKKILGILDQLRLKQSKVVQDFGIQVSNNFELIDARVLSPPQLTYAKNQVTPKDGVWNGQGTPFLHPAPSSGHIAWAVLNLDDSTKPHEIKAFYTQVCLAILLLFE